MVDISKLLELEGFKKVDYISKELHLTRRELSRILELKIEMVSGALKNGFVPHDMPENDKVHERIYNITFLFNYLLEMTDYRSKHLQEMWRNTGFWDSAIIKPPWYEKGLKNYLFRERYKGLESCIEWISRY